MRSVEPMVSAHWSASASAICISTSALGPSTGSHDGIAGHLDVLETDSSESA